MNQIPKVVFSRTLKEAAWPQSRIASGDLVEEIARLKAEPGGELVAHGGVRFAPSLIQHGLVDEYRLFTHPIALGRGKSPFSNLVQPLRLKTVNRVVFGTDLVLLTLQDPRGRSS
jgi:dihydrofolate reductase